MADLTLITEEDGQDALILGNVMRIKVTDGKIKAASVSPAIQAILSRLRTMNPERAKPLLEAMKISFDNEKIEYKKLELLSRVDPEYSALFEIMLEMPNETIVEMRKMAEEDAKKNEE